MQGGGVKGDMRVPVASVYQRAGGVVGIVAVAASAPAAHPHIDHDEEQISRLAHHLSQISGDHDGLQVKLEEIKWLTGNVHLAYGYLKIFTWLPVDLLIIWWQFWNL